MAELLGTPSDDLPDLLAQGGANVGVAFVSMSTRHPDGHDDEYLEWHTLDHRPEQFRVPELRSTIRVVSTPACRAARAISDERFDAVDHVMTYWFSDASGLQPFRDLATPLVENGRMSYLLPSVDRGAYRIDGMAAAPRIKAGADVLAWWPTTGLYILIERGAAAAGDLVEVPGVGGAWWGASASTGMEFFDPEPGLQLTYCFLDGDPVETADRLRPSLEKRWAGGGVEPLLAAPFHTVVPYEWRRNLP